MVRPAPPGCSRANSTRVSSGAHTRSTRPRGRGRSSFTSAATSTTSSCSRHCRVTHGRALPLSPLHPRPHGSLGRGGRGRGGRPTERGDQPGGRRPRSAAPDQLHQQNDAHVRARGRAHLHVWRGLPAQVAHCGTHAGRLRAAQDDADGGGSGRRRHRPAPPQGLPERSAAPCCIALSTLALTSPLPSACYVAPWASRRPSCIFRRSACFTTYTTISTSVFATARASSRCQA
eukprot:4869953-Prymnesium_polylepis.2